METIKPMPLDPKGRWWEPKDYPPELVEYGFFQAGYIVHPTERHVGLHWSGPELSKYWAQYKVYESMYGFIYSIYKVKFSFKKGAVSLPFPGILRKGHKEKFIVEHNEAVKDLVQYIHGLYPNHSVMLQIWFLSGKTDLIEFESDGVCITEARISMAAYPI